MYVQPRLVLQPYPYLSDFCNLRCTIEFEARRHLFSLSGRSDVDMFRPADRRAIHTNASAWPPSYPPTLADRS